MKKLFLFVTAAVGALTIMAETLEVSANMEIPSEGASYEAIVFKGGYTLSGGTVTLTDGATVSQTTPCAAKISCPLEVAEGATAFFLANTNGSFEVSGVLGGAGNYATGGNGGGRYTFSGANTFTGDLVLTNGVYYTLLGASALGAGASGKLVYKTNAAGNSEQVSQLEFGGVVTEKSIDENTGGNSNAFVFRANTENVFKGPVDSRNTMNRWQFMKNASLVVEGETTRFLNYFIPDVAATATVVFKERFSCNNFSFGSVSGKMVFEKGLGANPFYVANDGVATGCLVVKGGLYHADTTTAPVLKTNSGKLTFDLLDDVSVAGLALYKDTLHDNASQTFGSTNAATFRYQGTVDSTFAGAFAGDLALSVEAGKLELTGTSSSTGALSVSAGATLSFSGSAQWTGPSVAVAGRLECHNAIALAKDATLALTTGAKVCLDKNVSLMVKALTLDGDPLPDGTYSAVKGDYKDLFDGEGELVAMSGAAPEATWDAGGGADTSVRTAANWEGDQPPSLDGGLVEGKFALDGERASFPDAVTFRALDFSLLTGDFTLASASDAGELQLGAEGIRMAANANAAEGRTVTFDVPVELLSAQEWKIEDPAANLVFRRPIAGASVALVKSGPGGLTMAPDSTFTGSVTINAGTLVMTGTNPFGAAENPVTIARDSQSNPCIVSNATVRNPISLDNPDSDGWFTVAAGTTNRFEGHLSRNGILRPKFLEDSYTEFAGGMSSARSPFIVGSSTKGAKIVFSTKPCACYAVSCGYTKSSTVVEFACPSNTYGLYLQMSGDGTMRFSVPDAMVPAESTAVTSFSESTAKAVFDISGGDQHFGSFGYKNSAMIAADPAPNAQIFSAGPSRVFLDQRYGDCVNWASPFTGGAGLVKSGPKKFGFDNCTCTSTGEVAVAEGEFVFSATASWPKASKVSLTGGTLVLNGNEQLNRRSDWHVDAGTLSIPSGKTVTCRNLYKKVNGAWMLQDAGSYTSGFVTGGGTLVVRGGGLVFVVR